MVWSVIQTELNLLLHVVIAAILAGLIGLERELSHKPAGFRTHMIIGASAALFVLLGPILIENYGESILTEYLRTDPIRIVEAIVVGISFIGAGTILKHPREQSIQYLTTAASILMSAGVGIAVALEVYFLAGGITVLILIVNFLIRAFEKRELNQKKHKYPKD